MRIQLLKVLDQMGRDYLSNPSELKYVLAPIVAKNEVRQALFYELFDKYLAEVSQTLPKATPSKSWFKKKSRWIWASFFALLFVLIGLVIVIILWPQPIIRFSHSPTVSVGDTAHFYNQSEYLPSKYQLLWELKNGDDEIEYSDTLMGDWHLPINTAGPNPQKMIRLSLLNDQGNIIYADTSSLLIECAVKPLVDSLYWVDSISQRGSHTFQLIKKDNRNYTYQWFMNERELTDVYNSLTLTFDSVGFYTLRVSITALDEDGHCQKEITNKIVVSNDELQIARLLEKPLIKDLVQSSAYFKPIWWSLLGLLAFWPLWLWYRWWKFRQQTSIPKNFEELRHIFDGPDKPPYFIPFRPMTHVIQAGKELYEFANTLRKRQEGFRKELNIEKSLLATIEKGGFPDIKQDIYTQPSEYLFLIDEQHRDSIQSRLFEYLVNFLKDKNVYAEQFFYKSEPYSLWKRKGEEILNLQQLHCNFPYYRLVVMGDGHLWLSQTGNDAQAINAKYDHWIKYWNKRSLLTPLPPQSWTYKESGLHQIFSLFPADVEGIRDGFDDLQGNYEEDANVPFNRWQRDQIQLRAIQPDVNYRIWRNPEEIKDYLQDHPALWKWLCALAVHSVISWELTLAIGKALEKEGVIVTFDNLLILSRIPWLQQGHFPPELRLQLLETLDFEIETIARQTIKSELKAIKNLTKNSFVNFELKAELAMQNFLLDPENEKYQKVIRSLAQGDKPLTGKGRFKELDQQIKKYQKNNSQKPDGFQVFLNKTETQQSNQKTIPNQHIRQALVSSLLWLILLLLFIWLNGSDQLYLWSFGKTVVIIGDEVSAPRESLLAKEKFRPPDIAAQKNNEAVDKYIKSGPIDSVNLLLEDAIEEREYYPLAKLNLSKYQFNKGIKEYKQYFKTLNSSTLISASKYFQLATDHNSLRLDAFHGIGLCEWYLENLDRAVTIYHIIIEMDSTYFKTLGFKINLETLINQSSVKLIEPNMEFIKGDTFSMGCTKEQESVCRSDENPVHSVKVSDFYIGKYEVTNEEFAAFLNSEEYKNKEIHLWYDVENKNVKIKKRDKKYICIEGFEKHPVVGVYWYGAKTYAQWLSKETGKNYRLPSEAEWEYAARGGQKSKGFRYAGGDKIGEVAWFRGNSDGHTHQVGTRKTNELGLFDMSGNVWEWVEDCRHKNYFKAPDNGSAWLDEDEGICSYHVLRGGSWSSIDTLHLRISYRGRYDNEDNRPGHYGFRLVHEIQVGLPTSYNTFTDFRDGQAYKTVTIGSQTWMAQNLNYATSESWCYDELLEQCNEAGRLYTWDAAKTACPSGWHLPSDDEWQKLLNNYGGAGATSYRAMLKDGISGFAALLGGFRSYNAEFYNLGQSGAYWSATENIAYNAWIFNFNKDYGKVYRDYYNKDYALSCRCIKD